MEEDGTVMAEFSLIEEKENDCDHQYCVALCNSKLYLSFVDYKGLKLHSLLMHICILSKLQKWHDQTLTV